MTIQNNIASTKDKWEHKSKLSYCSSCWYLINDRSMEIGNNNSINEIFVRVGVRGRKLKVGAACLQVVGVCFLSWDEGGKDMA